MLLDRLVERPGDLSFWKTKLKDEESYVTQILPKEIYSFCDCECAVSLPLFFFSLATDWMMEDSSTNKPLQDACKLHQ